MTLKFYRGALLVNDNWSLITGIVDRIKQFPPTSIQLQTAMFMERYNILLDYGFHACSAEHLKDAVRQIETEKILPTLPHLSAVFSFHVAHAYFAVQDYHHSLLWLNTSITADAASKDPRTYHISRVIHLILHYELGNTKYLKYAIKSANSFFRKQKFSHTLEASLLKFLRSSLVEHHKPQKIRELLSAFKMELERAQLAHENLYILEGFHILAWVDSKLKNIPYLEAMKQMPMKAREKDYSLPG